MVTKSTKREQIFRGLLTREEKEEKPCHNLKKTQDFFSTSSKRFFGVTISIKWG